MDQGQVFFFQGPIRYGFAQECGGRLRPGINHEAPNALIQPMDGENFPAKLLLQSLRHVLLRVHPRLFPADHNAGVQVNQFHRVPPFLGIL